MVAITKKKIDVFFIKWETLSGQRIFTLKYIYWINECEKNLLII